MSAGRFVYLEDAAVKAKTASAVLVLWDGEEEWFPLSQVEDGGENLKPGESGYTVGITRWIAAKRGIEE